MFLSSENYLDQVKQLADSSRNLSLAVAFWGDGSEKLFESWQGESLRILCNLGSGGTNPYVIRRLLALANTRCGIEVRTLDDLHAKVMLGDNGAVVGSANFSSNGLGLEGDECSGWREAGLFTNDAAQLAIVQAWFDGIWDAARQISEEALQQAESNWEKRRNARPQKNIGDSLLEQDIVTLKDRPIYLAIFREYAGERAVQVYEEVKQSLTHSPRPDVDEQKMDFFADWPETSDSPLPNKGSIITVYYGPRQGVEVQNILRRIPELDSTYEGEEGEDSPGTVQILVREESACGWTLSPKDKKDLARRLKPWLSTLDFSDGARCIPLYEFLSQENQ
ncbi:PLD-like domain-containing protein [Azotobacter beijerinckii]|uniref:PLD-like domain-containing protein n=1 Tax=Azotobacter beijerinckii TaxID=170623 RepID=A0A1H6XCA4_9GAMM|nr:phospholipase D family protein [Azotobacter beijerinckii]SEJ22175.1 PLD-like domain-containing protein [Azotobacter beijerinckii]